MLNCSSKFGNEVSVAPWRALMGVMKVLGEAANMATGLRVFRTLPLGVDLFSDLARTLPDFRIESMMDVGANVGQSALQYSRRFPTATVWCFEPVAASFAALKRGTAHLPKVRCYQCAFSSAQGRMPMIVSGTSTGNRLTGREGDSFLEGSGHELVQLDTLDAFCMRMGLARINFVKVDTEGHELDVLRGAKRMLEEKRIDVIELEAGMNPSNEKHVKFEFLKEELEQSGYHLFGIYQQRHEFLPERPVLRRVNSAFVSKRLAGL